MKTLLIQVRPDITSREHELDCFVRRSGVGADLVRRLNILDEADANHDLLEGVDALVIGGSGDYLISAGDIPEKIDLVSRYLYEAREREVPTLGICFGAQIMAQVFGGKVEKDEARQELGTFEIKKRPSANFCPVFAELPERFHVQLGHKDHITALPTGAVNLASSERSEVQAFTFPGEAMYAFTFHPELDKEDIYWRLNHYTRSYDVTPEALADMQARTFSAEHGAKPLVNFYKHVVTARRVYRA